MSRHVKMLGWILTALNRDEISANAQSTFHTVKYANREKGCSSWTLNLNSNNCTKASYTSTCLDNLKESARVKKALFHTIQVQLLAKDIFQTWDMVDPVGLFEPSAWWLLKKKKRNNGYDPSTDHQRKRASSSGSKAWEKLSSIITRTFLMLFLDGFKTR